MSDTLEFTLNSPLTEEEWDMISDVDFDRTNTITFHTKHGKEVEFTKVIRCRDCKYYRYEIDMCDEPHSTAHNVVHEDDYCSRAERKETS